MRLHFHLPTGFVGGGERHLEYLVRHLRPPEATDDLEILITYQFAALAPFVEAMGVPSAQVNSSDALAELIDAHVPDVVQFYTSQLAYEALGLLRHRPRVIEVVHNVARFPGDGFSYPKDRTDFLVCVSPHARLFAWGQCCNVPALVIANGIDEARFCPAPGERAARPVIGFAGRLAPEKGIDTLIEIAARLPFPVELVGQDFGDYAARKSPNVTVLPETRSPEAYYRRWWAFVSASPKESFGMAIAEAMACGCPPVLLDCGGIVPYLRHGRDALIAATPDALESHVRDVVEGRIKLQPLEPRFSGQTMARRYLDAYQMELGRFSPPVRRARDRAEAPPAKVFQPVPHRPRVDGGTLGVTPHGWYGVVRALAGICDHYADTGHAIAAITRLRPQLVVLGCYQDEWLPICEHAHRCGARVVATWHASYILNEFHPINRIWMAQMLDAFRAGHIDHLATPHEGLARNWTHFGYPTAWLPNIIDETLMRQPALPGVHIGLFGSGQNWKNMECQIAAAGMIPGATIHTHALKHPDIVERLGIAVKVAPERLTDSEYHRLLGSMSVNLCVSQSEVYSYLTAESFLMETPVLTGSITPLVRDKSGGAPWLALCHTPFFEDPIAIRDQLLRLIEARDWLGPRLRAHILEVNRAYRLQCAKVLESWCGATPPLTTLPTVSAQVSSRIHPAIDERQQGRPPAFLG